MACTDFAKTYGNVPATPNKAWLLTSEWGCMDPDTKEFQKAAWCKENLDVPERKTTGGDPLPHLNWYKESGFLNYVNIRGMNCINRVLGKFLQKDENGDVLIPGPDVPLPEPKCAVICTNVTRQSKMCFECVAQALEENPDLCPDWKNQPKDRDKELYKAIDCQTCVAERAKTVDDAWRCITGAEDPFELSDAQLAGIIILGIILVVVPMVIFIRRGKKTEPTPVVPKESVAYTSEVAFNPVVGMFE